MCEDRLARFFLPHGIFGRTCRVSFLPFWPLNSTLATGFALHRFVLLTRFAGMNGVYSKFIVDPPPARATVQVARLPRDVKVEIDVIAIFPD